MTLEEMGNIGEFIAAIATIITLVYLALQIRQNTNLLKLSQIRGVQDDADRFRGLLIENKDVAAIYRRGLTDPASLDQEDRLRFRLLQDQLFFSWQAAFLQHQSYTTHSSFISGTLDQSGGKMYWEKSKYRFDTKFAEYVDQLT